MQEGIEMQEPPSGHGMGKKVKQERAWSLQHMGDRGNGLRGAQGTVEVLCSLPLTPGDPNLLYPRAGEVKAS